LRELLKAGISVGISSRGLGSVNQTSEGIDEVQDDYELLCWDFVSTPSTAGAYMSVVNESVDRTANLNSKFNIIKINNLILEVLTDLEEQ